MGPAVLVTPRPLGQPWMKGSTVDHLIDVTAARQQLEAALAALPHDYDEGAQRVQAALSLLVGIEADADRQLEAMGAYYAAALVEGEL